MYHLLSIIATLSLVSAIPLPQYDIALSSDIDTSDPWGTTAIDTGMFQILFPSSPSSNNKATITQTLFSLKPCSPELTKFLSSTANANTYLPNSPIILAEDPGWSRNVHDPSWNGKDRESHNGGSSGINDHIKDTGFSQEALDYWRARGLPRIQPKVNPAPPQQEDPLAPLPINNDPGPAAATAAAAAAVIKGLFDGVPPGMNPVPAGN